jgi:hypothetical protein
MITGVSVRRWDGLPGSCRGIVPARRRHIPVKKAFRPDVQLYMASREASSTDSWSLRKAGLDHPGA